MCFTKMVTKNDNETNEWRKLHNYELKMQFQRPDIVKEITKRRLMWGGGMPGISKDL